MQKRKLQSDGCHCVRWADGAGRVPVPRLPEPLSAPSRDRRVVRQSPLLSCCHLQPRRGTRPDKPRAAAGWSCGVGTQTYLDAISQIPFMSFLIWGALFDFSAIKWG